MRFDADQKSIITQSVAVLSGGIVLAKGYLWLSPVLVGASGPLETSDRRAFALRWDFLVLAWLLACVRSVAQGRFWSPADRDGSARAAPSGSIAVRAAILQNSLEQTLLAVGGHLILATVLRGPELVLIPLLVLLYLCGRAAFATRYSRSPIARASGMALTGASVAFTYAVAAWLIVAGR